MIAAVCLDDRNGMLFNGRRLSRDRAQQEDLLALCGEKKLRIGSFSAKLFQAHEERVVVDDDFLTAAGAGEIVFVEDRGLLPLSARLEGVIVYRWNRAYPSDMQFDLDLSAFTCTERVEFPGNSHDIITREVYMRT